MGLLAESRSRKSIGKDPNNTKWTRDTTTFGQRILRSQGWEPGQYLGAQDSSLSELHTAANASYIRVALKDDMKGLGFSKSKEDEVTGLDVFSDLLSRLNGKSEAQVDADKAARLVVKTNRYLEQKWGPMRFVSGGLLVGDSMKEEQAGGDDEASDSTGSTGNLETSAATTAASVAATKPKKRKAASQDDSSPESSSDEDERLKKERKKRRKEEKRAKKEEKDKKKDKKKKEKEKSVSEPTLGEASAEDNSLNKDKADRKKSKKAQEDEPSDSSSEPKKSKKSKTDKEDKKERKRLKQERKEKKKREKREKESPSQDSSDTSDGGAPASTTASSGKSTPALSGTSTPSALPHRNFVRSRFIAQKQRVLMDTEALNQILMIKT